MVVWSWSLVMTTSPLASILLIWVPLLAPSPTPLGFASPAAAPAAVLEAGVDPVVSEPLVRLSLPLPT